MVHTLETFCLSSFFSSASLKTFASSCCKMYREAMRSCAWCTRVDINGVSLAPSYQTYLFLQTKFICMREVRVHVLMCLVYFTSWHDSQIGWNFTLVRLGNCFNSNRCYLYLKLSIHVCMNIICFLAKICKIKRHDFKKLVILCDLLLNLLHNWFVYDKQAYRFFFY